MQVATVWDLLLNTQMTRVTQWDKLESVKPDLDNLNELEGGRARMQRIMQALWMGRLGWREGRERFHIKKCKFLVLSGGGAQPRK